MTDHIVPSEVPAATSEFTDKDLEWVRTNLAFFYGYHQGPRPRMGARVRHRRDGVGTVVSHSIGDYLFVRYDTGEPGRAHMSAYSSAGEPRRTLHQMLTWLSLDPASRRDPTHIAQLAGHFRGDNGARYINRAAYLWSVHALCHLRLFDLDNPKLMHWLNREIQGGSDEDRASLPPPFRREQVELEVRTCSTRRTAEMEAQTGLSLVRALELGKASIDMATNHGADQVDSDVEGLERTLATDIAEENEVIILGRTLVNPGPGMVDVIDLDTLSSYTRHVSGLNIGSDVMNPGWFWDVITQSTLKNPQGMTVSWWASDLQGPDGQESDEPARRRVAMFAHLVLARYADRHNSFSGFKRHLKRARELHRTLDRAERTKLAAVAPELVAPEVHGKLLIKSLGHMAQLFRQSVETMLHVLPVPEPAPEPQPDPPAIELRQQSDGDIASTRALDGVNSPTAYAKREPLKPRKVAFQASDKALRFQFSEHLFLASEWNLVDAPIAFESAVTTALSWLERRLGLSLPKHWREGAHEIERAGVSLQIEASPALFAFRIEHPDLEQPTRWWRVEATVLQGRDSVGGMVGMRMQVRDLVELPAPQRSVPALIRSWAGKPGLRVAGARTKTRTQISDADHLDQLHHILQRKSRDAPVWVASLESKIAIPTHSPLTGLGRLIRVSPSLSGYTSRYGVLPPDTLHVFAPGQSQPVVFDFCQAGWQDKLCQLALDMRHKPETPSFRDVRDAIHRHRIERASAAAILAAQIPLVTGDEGLAHSPEVETREEALHPASQSSAVPAALDADFPTQPPTDENLADDVSLSSSLPLDPSVTDALQVRRELREYVELLDLAENERDQAMEERELALQERDAARAEAMGLRHALKMRGVAASTDASPATPPAPDSLAQLPAWAPSLAPRVVFADKAIKFAARTTHQEVAKIYASLQALADHYWVMRFGEDDLRDQAFDAWTQFLQQQRLRLSGPGKAAEQRQYESEYKAIVDGERYVASSHISGSSKFDTQRCLRIYLDVDEVKQRIVVIHLPTHLTSSHT